MRINKYILHCWQWIHYFSIYSWIGFHFRKLKSFCEFKIFCHIDYNDKIPSDLRFEKLRREIGEGREGTDFKPWKIKIEGNSAICKICYDYGKNIFSLYSRFSLHFSELPCFYELKNIFVTVDNSKIRRGFHFEI